MAPERVDNIHWRLFKHEYVTGSFDKITSITVHGPQDVTVETCSGGEEMMVIHSRGVCYIGGNDFEKVVKINFFGKKLGNLSRQR